jgi:hypothetical protein
MDQLPDCLAGVGLVVLFAGSQVVTEGQGYSELFATCANSVKEAASICAKYSAATILVVSEVLNSVLPLCCEVNIKVGLYDEGNL